MTSLDGPSGNIALLIDADNASAAHFDPVMTVLAELGTVNIRRAYGNWSKATLKSWAALSIAQAIEPQQQFDLTKGKNATDMKMTIDAMDLMASGRVSGFGLMSSDSDFTPLVTRIRQQGIPVYGFGRMSSPEGFRRAARRRCAGPAHAPAVRRRIPKSSPPGRACAPSSRLRSRSIRRLRWLCEKNPRICIFEQLHQSVTTDGVNIDPRGQRVCRQR